MSNSSAKCSRRECKEPAFKTRYCVKHYRFHNMKSRACTSRKRSPLMAELELLVPVDMVCPPCGRKMNWLYEDGRSTVITLQHDRSGEVRMICMACNVRHSRNPGDSFYKLRPDQWRCAVCKKIKDRSEFVRVGNRIGACLPCHNQRGKKWKEEHRERYNRLHREAEQRRRDKVKINSNAL